MQHLRFLNMLGVACTLLCASSLLIVRNGYACNWQAELMDYSGAERLTKASGWYPWHREEVYHGDH
jgi:hypothetical protein